MNYPRYPEYKPSGVEWLGGVPAHWAELRLKNVASIRVSNVDKKSVEGQEPVRLCNYVDVYYHDQITPDLEFMEATATTQQIEKFALKKGDVLITKDSETPDDIAVPSFVSSDLNGVVCGYHLALIRPQAAVVEGAYLARSLAALGVRDQFHSSANGITRFGLSFSDISGASVLVPPLDEQHAIAAFLDRETARIDALVAKKQRLIELFAEKRTALISQAVTKGLNPGAPMKDSGVEWLGEIPAHWEARKFSREVHIAEGQVDPEAEPYASMLLVAPNHIESATGRLLAQETAAEQGAESGKYLCRSGEVIYSKIRPALAKVALAPEDCLCSADMYPLDGRPRFENRYLYWLLLSREFTAWSVLESDRVAMPKINRETLSELRLPVPPLDEQRHITGYLERETTKVDQMVEKVQEAVERIQEYRTSLITSAVTGKIDVRSFARQREDA